MPLSPTIVKLQQESKGYYLFMSVAIFFAHMDDEVFLIPTINRLNAENKKIYCYFLTKSEGRNDRYSQEIRESESIKFLSRLAPNAEVNFLGKILDVKDLELHLNLEKIYDYLLSALAKDVQMIITPHFEGGHIDHDSASILGRKISEKLLLDHFTFALYKAKFKRFKFFEVAKIKKDEQSSFKLKVDISSYIYYLLIPFIYKSQWRTWLGIYPFLVTRIIFRRDYKIFNAASLDYENPPNSGNLLYSRRNDGTYQDWKSRVQKFLDY